MKIITQPRITAVIKLESIQLYFFRHLGFDSGRYAIHGTKLGRTFFLADPALDAGGLINDMHFFLFSGNGIHRAGFGADTASHAFIFLNDK